MFYLGYREFLRGVLGLFDGKIVTHCSLNSSWVESEECEDIQRKSAFLSSFFFLQEAPPLPYFMPKLQGEATILTIVLHMSEVNTETQVV